MKSENVRYFFFGLLVALAFVFLIAGNGDTDSTRYQIAVIDGNAFVLLNTATGQTVSFLRPIGRRVGTVISGDDVSEAFE